MSAQHPSSSEKEEIEKELQEAVNTLKAGCEALDMEMAFGVFSDSSDFLMMGTDGSLCDCQTYLNNNIDYLTTCSNFKLTTLGEQIRILDRDVAIFSWAYRSACGSTPHPGRFDLTQSAPS
jgi:hypothetical protein